ncbi:PREDICTED: putative leucine-rich repeat receptor-like serine/threonine-protein kinase At2g24130 [Nicotiana attenuata]|uniref:non-specific serine/threonine protein kinase n=1 Tax=Nicotiana attenuata TaxID=49451 RepID=A0A1J6KVD4_NICAT|nr:PREDICTED: putative leucine-rich repeat receptor-like serine/threonine-protein kinase At2g24130 [Nicotiana attenuata]OIT23033.1 putative leucine-rich repeat receptor-like serinethreonine-protein kinase [Nicotiana attenuata]
MIGAIAIKMGYYKFSKYNFFFLIMVFSVVLGQKNDQMINDRASLLSFMAGIVSDPYHALESWNSSSIHLCNWTGVGCDQKMNRVVELDLSHHSLRGTISSALSGLSFLQILDLSGNLFEGKIPAELGYLLKLNQLSLSSNLLEGKIPVELGLLHKLKYLDLGSNNLSGEIPLPLFCNCSASLQYMDLSNNSLSGEIPMYNQCELKELKFLLLWSNNLVGEVPKALSNSTKLEWLDIESNLLSGELPSDIVSQMPKLQFLYLSYNNFITHRNNTDLTPFFASLVNSSNLQELELAGNNLGGELPPIIGNISKNLAQIHLDDNLIYGPIPTQISNLGNLTLLNLSSNHLNGTIPLELCQMGKLERLYLSNNSLSGVIPSAFGNLSHLGLLDLSKNKLSGLIPDTFSNLPQLRRLLLHNNQLSGTIPSSLGQCINLEILDLSHNRISGKIPSEVAGLSSLKIYLNLSNNHLHGPIPLELSKMDMVLAIDLSSNNLSATVPSQLGSCIALEYLNISRNALEGALPSSIGRLPYLKELDVSFNVLNGEIPQSFQASSTLQKLNFSYNHFSGNATNTGAFSSLNISSFLGNFQLCGSIQGMKSCHKKRGHHFIITILLSLLITPIFCIVGYPLVLRSKFRSQWTGKVAEDTEQCEKKEQKYPRISHMQLIEATGGFSSSSLIGEGRYGRVYKGVLRNNMRIAVKVIDSKTAGESFKRECQILKRTRHRNLIRIITTCSRPDIKALVFPLMSNGSLENHLYPSVGLKHQLDLAQVVSICNDVAEGVAYLHHYSPVKVVHCDLKPSNILLDYNMTALVTDFGISRLVKAVEDITNPIDESVSYNSTDGLLCGSIGYIAPEYGMGKRASTKGDVYSFGVLLLEIVTGKRPTDILFQQGSSLHEWVKSQYPHKLEPMIDETLQRYPQGDTIPSDSKMWRDIVFELIELGLMCTQYNPSTRPTMLDVALEIGRLKQYISSPCNFVVEDVTTMD